MNYKILNQNINLLSNKNSLEIEVLSFDKLQTSYILAGCTSNYLQDHFEGDMDKFTKFVINKKWVFKMDSIFNKKVHVDAYSDTKEGMRNIEFLLIEKLKLYKDK